jgi:prevent-host-death family protein
MASQGDPLWAQLIQKRLFGLTYGPIQAVNEDVMQLAVSEAKAKLTDLVRRAEAGEEVILTRHGQAVVRLVPVRLRPDASQRARLIAMVRARAAAKCIRGPAAERSQDFLYDDAGLPE